MQDYGYKTIREVSIPTGAWVASDVIEKKYLKNQLVLCVQVVIGTATSVDLKVEFSDDGVTYFQRTIATENGATGIISYTLATDRFPASGNYTVEIPIKYQYIRISVMGVGVLTTTTVGIDAITGIA